MNEFFPSNPFLILMENDLVDVPNCAIDRGKSEKTQRINPMLECIRFFYAIPFGEIKSVRN